MYEMLDVLQPLYPENMPRYLMGVGAPDYIIEGVLRGIDMFDCVLPTRIARNGTAMTSKGKVVVRNACYKETFSSGRKLRLLLLQKFFQRYLRHLVNCNEIEAAMLLSIHNVNFLLKLTENIRTAIAEDRLGEFRENFYRDYYNEGVN